MCNDIACIHTPIACRTAYRVRCRVAAAHTELPGLALDRCLHNSYGAVTSNAYVKSLADDAVSANSLCGSGMDTSETMGTMTGGPYTNSVDSTQNYASYPYYIRYASIRSEDTAGKVISAWYSEGLAECTSEDSGNTLPGCVANSSITMDTSNDNDDSSSESDDDSELPFMAMVNTATVYFGCHTCSSGLRVVCVFLGHNDTCTSTTDCSTCSDPDESACHTTTVPAVNSSKTEANCKVEVDPVTFSQTSSSTSSESSDDDLSDLAIAMICLLTITVIGIMAVLFKNRDLLKRKIFGSYGKLFKEDEKFVRKSTIARQNTRKSLKARARSMNHNTANLIFNPHLDEETKSAAEHLPPEAILKQALMNLPETTELRSRSRNTVVKFAVPQTPGEGASTFIGHTEL